jgi:uncharacterized protein YbaP (TraB family)
VLVFLTFTGFSQPLSSTNQLLWQISGKGLKKQSYLFGTFHSNDNRIFQFSDSTYIALLKSNAIVLEADIYSMFEEYDSRIENYNMNFDPSGRSYTTSKKASTTKYGNEDGRPQFLDAYLQQFAYNSQKKFFALETVQEQLIAYENITYSSQKEYNFGNLTIGKDYSIDTYQNGDIEGIRQMLKAQLSVSGNAYNLIITNRNIVMANGIDTLIKKNNSFIGIGAAHLAGEEGVIQLLRNKGYTLRPVMASFSAKPTPEALEIRKYNSSTYIDSLHRFSAVFGGVPKVNDEDGHRKLIYQEMGQGNTFLIEVFADDSNRPLENQIEDFFSSSKNIKPREVWLDNQVQAFEGNTFIIGIGDCWRRVFIYEGNIFKITCYGGNKFMNSDRYRKFFNQINLF